MSLSCLGEVVIYLSGELLLHGLDEVDVGEDLLLLLDVLRPRALDGLGVDVVEVFLLVLLLLGAATREREQMRK